jgi:outer membrane biogenesis lipoprotein LolB
MLDQIRNSSWFRVANAALLLAAVAALSSCAGTDKKPEKLVSDSPSDNDSAIPWNEQQKWETEGQLGQVAGQQSRR